MELRQVRYFLAVADARSFVSAAEKLFVSRQAISKSVAQLEEELNVELFMRDSNGAFLTPAGVMFYDRVRTLVMEMDSVRSQMRSYGARYHQRVRIAFSVGTVGLLEQRLLEYRDNQYNADITYTEETEGDCLKLLLEHKADVIVTTDQLLDPLFVTEPLLSSPMGILIKEQEQLQEVEVKDLSWIPLAGQNESQIKGFCKDNGIALRYTGYDLSRLLELTREGKCALVIPKCLVPKDTKGMQWLTLDRQSLWRLYLSYPKSAERNLAFSNALSDMHKRVFMPLVSEKETV